MESKYYSISLYEDSHSLITTALAALALSEPCSGTTAKPIGNRDGQKIHPRYQCRNHCQYIAEFALPAYLSKAAQPAV